MSIFERLEIYDLNIHSNNLYIPRHIKRINPIIIGKLPGRNFFTIDPMNKEIPSVHVDTKFIIKADTGGILILDVP
ncbi:hypothetical protein UT300005_27610 [Clostridium sp. CTA-5]